MSDRSLPRLTLLQLADHGPQIGRVARVRLTAGVFPQPVVIARSGWGADESLRFDASGKEVWPAAFYPVQKVIVHHTAGANSDPDPAATIRSIYYYHAITQAWGDIGYNFLIDESGRIYEGRYSRSYAAGESPTGADLNGNGVTAAHAQGYNSGTVGIALLGTLTNQDATPAARSALEHLIAWIDSSHGIDPQGASLYTNPVSGLQATFANIAGHRDVGATECPGGTFYATLPTLRSHVAALLPSTAPDFALAVSPSSQSVLQGQPATYNVTVTPSGGFTSQVGLSVSGLPIGATATFTPTATASTSTLQITTATTTPAASYALTIIGTSGSLTHTTRATLVVNPLAPPDFILTATPTSISVSRRQTATYTITLGAVNGFTGSVNLTVTGLPSKTSATFTPNPASTTSALTVTTNRRSPTGTFTLTVTGKSSALTHTASITLTLS
ncbi:MAG: peptidoglycan recognition protein family protein [Actinomycetota bacterium]|nr:peptidoglycan recognition protein family protein [Actinomycetota bacterium]